MRVLFAGTPAVAVPALSALHASGHEVVGVLTRPPAPVGRRRVLTPSPVHSRATELGLPAYTTEPNSPEVHEVLAAVDCVAVVAYGVLIRDPALSMPRHGWINLHYSLLPRWRGAAPVQHAIMAGDEMTGISVFQIEAGLDTGPVYTTVPEPIHPDQTAGDLLGRLTEIGAPVLVQTLDRIEAGTAHLTPQRGPVTLAPTLTSADGLLDWTRPATEVAARIRGLTPAPGAWTRDADGNRYKIGPVVPTDTTGITPGQVHIEANEVWVGTGSTAVTLRQLAPPGKPWMAAADWSRGLHGKTPTFEGRP